MSMNGTAEMVILVVSFFWLCALTILFFKFYLYYTRLIKNEKGDSLVAILDSVSKRQEENKEAIENLLKLCEQLKKDGSLHIQKIGLLRFNPFHDTGGDQSFILALLDSHDTGVVISSLHTRTGARWYAKGVLSGRGQEHELSNEEQKAIKSATVHHFHSEK